MSGFRIAGAIEGFYGPPWSWDERERFVDFLAEHGFNAYAYAPKNDPLHRSRWREPYLPEEWERFAALAARCADAGVDFVFGISPMAFNFTSEDFDNLERKLRAADAVGIRHFCLQVDDMPARGTTDTTFSTVAGPDVALVEATHEILAGFGPGRGLWFCPDPYSGSTDTPYLRELGEKVPADVDILWTGPQVCSAEVTLDHAREVAATLGRRFLLWDNHPVNDGAMHADPHLGPIRNRDPYLPEAVAGILSNLALEPEASRIAVATFGDYSAAPRDYDPEASWQEALRDVTGDPDDAAAVAVLADLACRSPLEPGRTLENRLAPVLEHFWERWATNSDRHAALDDVGATLNDLAASADRLENLSNHHLRDDLLPWSGLLRRQVTAARLAVDILRRSLDAPEDPAIPELRRRALQALDDARDPDHWVATHQLDAFARGCLHAAGADGHVTHPSSR